MSSAESPSPTRRSRGSGSPRSRKTSPNKLNTSSGALSKAMREGTHDPQTPAAADKDEEAHVTFEAVVRICKEKEMNVNDEPEPEEVMALPISRLSAAKKAFLRARGKIGAITGTLSADTHKEILRLDTLPGYKHRIAQHFGIDIDTWAIMVGQEKREVFEEDGHTVTRISGMYWGTEIKLYLINPYFDIRLQAPEPEPAQSDDLNAEVVKPTQEEEYFDYSQYHVQLWEVTNDAFWEKVVDDQPWSVSRLRRNTLAQILSKITYHGEGMNEQKLNSMRLEAVHAVWELAVNKPNHANINLAVQEQLVTMLRDLISVEQAILAATVTWHLMSTQTQRSGLTQLGLMEVLMDVLRYTLKVVCVPRDERRKLEKGEMKELDREKLQYRTLATLAVAVCDKGCRAALLQDEGGSLKTLFKLAEKQTKGGYDASFEVSRRLLAAQVITNLLIRDAAFRRSVVPTGGVLKLMEWFKEEDAALVVPLQQCAGSVMQHYANDVPALEAIFNKQQLGPMLAGCYDALLVFVTQLENRRESKPRELHTLLSNVEALAFGVWGAARCAGMHDFDLNKEYPEAIGDLAVRLKAVHGKKFKGCKARLDTSNAMYTVVTILTTFANSEPIAAVMMTCQRGANPADLRGAACGKLAVMLEIPPPVFWEEGGECEYDASGKVRASAVAALACLSWHPVVKTEEVMMGFHLDKLLALGIFSTVLRAMLVPATHEAASAMLMETASVLLLNLATAMTDQLEPWMVTALMDFMSTSENMKVVEHLIATFWVLLRTPNARKERTTARRTPIKSAFRGWELRRGGQANHTRARAATVGVEQTVRERLEEEEEEAESGKVVRSRKHLKRQTSILKDASAVEDIIQDDNGDSPLTSSHKGSAHSVGSVAAGGAEADGQAYTPSGGGDGEQDRGGEQGEQHSDAGNGGDDDEGEAAVTPVAAPEKPDPAAVNVNHGLQTLLGVARKWWARVQGCEGVADDKSPTKMIEFLLAAIWLYVIDDEHELQPRFTNVSQTDRVEVPDRRKSDATWWTVVVGSGGESTLAALPPLIAECLQVLLAALWFTHRALSKAVQMAVKCLWAFTARNHSLELELVRSGLANSLLTLCEARIWTPALHAAAASYLADLLDSWDNLQEFGETNLKRFHASMVRFVASGIPRLEAAALRILGHLTSHQPFQCPKPKRLLGLTKDSVAELGGIGAVHDLLMRKLRSLITEEEELDPYETEEAKHNEILKHAYPGVEFDEYFLGRLDYDLPGPEELGRLAVLAHALRLLRNLSVRTALQVSLARVCMLTFLRLTSEFQEWPAAAAGASTEEAAEAATVADIQNQLSIIMTNIAAHPDNRTRLYKVELQGTHRAMCEYEDALMRASLPTRLHYGASTFAGGPAASARDAARRSLDSLNPLTLRPKARFPTMQLGPLSPRRAPTHDGEGGEDDGGTAAALRADTLLALGKAKKAHFYSWMQSTFSNPAVAEAVGRITQEEEGFNQHLHPRMVLTSKDNARLGLGGAASTAPESEYAPASEDLYGSAMSSRASSGSLAGKSGRLTKSLCRPRAHLWRPVDERGRQQGQNRWCPPISEYLEEDAPAEGQAAFSKPTMAAKLLATKLPKLAPKHITSAASAHLAAGPQLRPPSTSADGKVRLRRPETRERFNGRQAMTRVSETTMQRHATAAGDGDGGASRPLHLKVSLAPQCNRHVITFKSGVMETKGVPPKLTVFENVPGAKVYEGLFPDYTLPNGLKAHFYYTIGDLVEEASVALYPAPERANKLTTALQNGLPLDVAVDNLILPPGPYADNRWAMYKPLPPLAPLPDRHTLPVKRPERVDDASAFGELRTVPLHLFAHAVTKHQQRVEEHREENRVATPKTPWTLPMSIFKPRVRECDSKGFWDNDKVAAQMAASDIERMMAKDKCMSFINREGKGCTSGPIMDVLTKIIESHYTLIRATFTYYASLGSGSPYHIQLNAFTTFLEDCGIPDSESKGCKRSDCDTMFIEGNYEEKGKALPMNDAHALMRYEFVEVLIRLSAAKYGHGQTTNDLAEALTLMLEKNIVPNLPAIASTQSNVFRTDRLYFEENDAIFKKHEKLLKAMYSRYRLPPKSGSVRLKQLGMDGWEAMAEDTKLITDGFPLGEYRLCYLMSRMTLKNEIKDWLKNTTLTFVDFLEALGRVADAMMIPTREDLEKNGFENWFQWQKNELEGSGAGAIPRRESAGYMAPKTRKLHEKIEGLLDIIFRRLFFDPTNPDAEYSAEKLCQYLQKIDKNLGP